MKPPRHTRRAFALPLVIIIALVASLAIGIVLMRHGTSHLAVERQIETYRDHHRHMGVQELVDRWITTTRGSIREVLGEGGLAFELALPGGIAKVYLEDAQGTALDDFRSLHGPETRIARRMVALLDAAPITGTPEGAELVFRKHGPAKLSAHTARPEVLDALAQAVTPTGDWERFSRELQQRRTQRELVLTDIRAIANEVGLSGEETASLEIMLTTEPTVWKVTVLLSTTGRREGAEGLIETGSGASSMGRATRFLSWRDLAEDNMASAR